MKSKAIILIFVAVSGRLMAQNAVEDIRKINLAINQPTKLEVGLSYKVFSDSTTTHAMQTQEGQWIKNGLLQYHSLGATETIRKAGELQVLVDHESKTVVVSNAPVKQSDNPASAMAESLTEMLATCRSVKYKSMSNGLAAYELHPYVSEFSKIIVVFEKKTFLLRKMILQQANAVNITEGDLERWILPRIEIEFSSIALGRASENKLQQSKFVEKKNGVYALTAPYKDYQLNNYLLTN
jgi:hypothetical protein